MLALDTCDARGSVAVCDGGRTLGILAHEGDEDYSSWLLPAVGRALRVAGRSMDEVDAYAAASGPGSFTGLRVGLTTVKAWSEVYGRPIVAVSRLEAFAAQAGEDARWVAVFVDAHREQIFGALYRRNNDGKLERIEDELVLAPEQFVAWVGKHSGPDAVAWISPDAERVTGQKVWQERENAGARVQKISPVLAAMIGKIGYQKLLEKRTTDALTLDANYVRRSDAELHWKVGSGHGR